MRRLTSRVKARMSIPQLLQAIAQPPGRLQHSGACTSRYSASKVSMWADSWMKLRTRTCGCVAQIVNEYILQPQLRLARRLRPDFSSDAESDESAASAVASISGKIARGASKTPTVTRPCA